VSQHSINNISDGKEQAEDCERMALDRACEPVTAALLYAQRGWRVFPSRGKTPLTPHGFKDATTDPEAIEVWWRNIPTATISVATGRISGVVVLDIDNKSSGPIGWDSLEELGLSSLVDTPIAHTPSGGAHYYFDPSGREIPSSVGKLGACLDVKGERACCVLPTPGAPHWWDPHKNPTTTPLAPAPEWLAPPPKRPISKALPARPSLGELTPYGANAINSAVSRVYTAPQGQQAITLNREAYGVGQLVGAGIVPERIALDALMHGALAMPSYDRWHPWRRNEIERSVKQSFEAGIRRPRDGR
jgi:putative DNA primase/helicase